jgi:hypothetical protein
MKARTLPPGRIDWLRLETLIRDALREYDDYRTLHGSPTLESAMNALRAISDAVGSETGRGYPLED